MDEPFDWQAALLYADSASMRLFLGPLAEELDPKVMLDAVMTRRGFEPGKITRANLHRSALHLAISSARGRWVEIGAVDVPPGRLAILGEVAAPGSEVSATWVDLNDHGYQQAIVRARLRWTGSELTLDEVLTPLPLPERRPSLADEERTDRLALESVAGPDCTVVRATYVLP